MNPNDPTLKSFIDIPKNHDFPIQNLPYGVFSTNNQTKPRVGVAIGDYVLDLAVLEKQNMLQIGQQDNTVFNRSSLNPFMALGQEAWLEARRLISELLRHDNPELRDNNALREQALIPQKDIRLHLPIQVTEYTDFYSSEHHASNIGKMFRPDQAPLLPNWKHMPVAYNGRASSVVVGGTPIKRPRGQIKPTPDEPPVFADCQRLDIELEMGFVVGTPSEWGTPVSTAEAEKHIFGLMLLNDWSARDIQKWEYVPLGPFLSKAFATSISPWVVPLPALEPFKVAAPKQNPSPLAYLQDNSHQTYDIQLEVLLQTPELAEPTTICRTNYREMYWTMAQQLAHHTITGCNIRTGDLMGSGTISGTTPDSFGSLLELAWAGKNPIKLPNGETRVFLQDHDTITLYGYCANNDYRIGFGELSGEILPSGS